MHDLLHWDHGALNYLQHHRRGLSPSLRVQPKSPRLRSRSRTFCSLRRRRRPLLLLGVRPTAARRRSRRGRGGRPPVRAAAAAVLGAAAGVVVVAGGVGLQVLGLRDPVEVAAEVLLDLLPLSVLLEVAPRLGLLPLFRKFSARLSSGGERKWFASFWAAMGDHGNCFATQRCDR